MNYSNHPATKEYRQLLRKTETPTERMLWKKLRGKQFDGYRFRQQHFVLIKIRNYINTCINRSCEGVQTPNPLT